MFPEGRALEFLVAAVIALVVVGPKDLPVLMRKLGQFTGKMRAMAAEFRASFDEMARQSELDELRKEVEAMRKAQFADVAERAAPEIHQTVTEIHQDLTQAGQELHGGQTPAYPYHEASSDPAEVAAAPESPPAPAPTEAAPAPAPKPRAKRAAAASNPAPRKAAAKPRARKKAEPGE